MRANANTALDQLLAGACKSLSINAGSGEKKTGMSPGDFGSQCCVDSVDRPVVIVLPVISPHTG